MVQGRGVARVFEQLQYNQIVRIKIEAVSLTEGSSALH